MATANQRIHNPDYPHFITQDWTLPYRQQRIEALLAANPKHSTASFRVIQGDQLSLASLTLLPHLKATVSKHPLAAAALREMIQFDGVMAADRAAPLILVAWADELTRVLVGERLGAERLKALYGKRQFRNAVEDMLQRQPAAWCGEGGCAAASTRALDTALTTLQARYGSTFRHGAGGRRTRRCQNTSPSAT